ncbi:MAG TPA: hypothetical protein VF351_06135 [Actinomycetota bacterium]
MIEIELVNSYAAVSNDGRTFGSAIKATASPDDVAAAVLPTGRCTD